MRFQSIHASEHAHSVSASETEHKSSNWLRFCLTYVAAITFALLCGPVGARLAILGKTCPLPKAWAPIIETVDFTGFLLLMFGAVAAICIPIGAIASLASKDTRKFAAIFLIMSVVTWGSWPLNWKMAPLKNWGMRNAIDAAQPLIAAIETYKIDNGSLPDDLELLKPKYIDAIPYTRMVGYPEFHYVKRQANSKDTLFNEYEIGINTSIGILNWDCFVYWPEEKYPVKMYGGWVERIDGWAYVHE